MARNSLSYFSVRTGIRRKLHFGVESNPIYVAGRMRIVCLTNLQTTCPRLVVVDVWKIAAKRMSQMILFRANSNHSSGAENHLIVGRLSPSVVSDHTVSVRELLTRRCERLCWRQQRGPATHIHGVAPIDTVRTPRRECANAGAVRSIACPLRSM